MKIFTIFLVLFSFSLVFAQGQAKITYSDLTIAAEQNPQLVIDARKLTNKLGFPHTIYTTNGVFIEAKGIENGKVVYAVTPNITDYSSGHTAYYDELKINYDLSNSRQHFVERPTINPTLGLPAISSDNTLAASFLIMPESTGDRVLSFDPTTGDLVDTNFIPSDPTNLATPINAILSPTLKVLVSDQLNDHVAEYDTSGTFNYIFWGGNTAYLDNIRGIEITPDRNFLLVTVASGSNSDAVAKIDMFRVYQGNFIAPNTTNLDSPWDIVFRNNDCLATGGSSNNIAQYDLNGNFLNQFASSIAFPEQLHALDNGNVIVANFSTPSGIRILDSTGAELNFFTSVTGLRGCYALGNGNYLVTNGSGVFEIDGATGALLETKIAGVSARFIDAFDLSIVPVELISFIGSNVNSNVLLNWTTGTETNNSGFEIQRSSDRIIFNNIAFVPGFGTTTERRNYSYTDNSANSGKYFYRLKQIDFNGAFEYSNIIEVELVAPNKFDLKQNYPNPFNPSTVISYQLAANSQVTLKVYDIIGNEVSTLVDENQDAGNYDVQFDASILSNGVYFYTIKADNFTSTKKMILVK